MFCQHCGTEKMKAEAQFCTNCGKPFDSEQPQAMQMPAPPPPPQPMQAYAAPMPMPAEVRHQPPPPPLYANTAGSSALPEFKKTPVIVIILFTIFTMGFYYPFWFIRRKDAFNRLASTNKLGVGLPLAVIVLFVVSLALSIGSVLLAASDSSASMSMASLGSFINIVTSVMLIVTCFKCRRILIDHFNGYLQRPETFSAAGVLFFGALYLQYKINRL